MKNKIISFILTVVTLFLCTVPVFAQEQDEEIFISDVSLVYRDSLEEAQAAIENTDWKIYEKNLNRNADLLYDTGVFLIYKTTTNVEEAITDLRVMDMYGGYSTSNYQEQLEESRKEYLEKIKLLKIVIDEFEAVYTQGNEMAQIAYRQLNYYKDAKASATSDETGLLLGDFFLSQPSEEAILQVLMEGNALIVSNVLTLLTIGVSGSAESSLVTRLNAIYPTADTLDKELYQESASYLYDILYELRPQVIAYDNLKDKFNIDDEDMTEEEFNFCTEIVPIVTALDEIKLGDTSLCQIVRDGAFTIKELYPIVAALSPAQTALVKAGLFETVIKYASPKTPDESFYESIEHLEEDLKDENGRIVPIDLYLGVDRSIFEGSFATTDAAQRHQALTGESWGALDAAKAISGFHIAAMAVLGIDALFSTAYFGTYGFWRFIHFLGNMNIHFINTSRRLAAVIDFSITYVKPWLKTACWTAVGVALVAAGLFGIGTLYNYYNPDYTYIPNTIIDIKEGDIGDHYVKYTAAKVFGEEHKNADFNAYEGKEWIALYYTKDINAGNCLTPNFVYSEKDPTVARRHQGVSMFGETRAFNLNSHTYERHAPAIYLSVKYSITEKEAEKLPNVIGAVIATGGAYAICALGGAGLGVGSMMLYNRHKKLKKESEKSV